MLVAQILFTANGLWFATAFVHFSLAQDRTAKILVPRESRQDPLVPTIKASVAFLGGMNLTLALFAFYLATWPVTFAQADAQGVLFTFFAAANFSQFFFNLPILLRGWRTHDAVWPVLAGPMLIIFSIDGILTILDSVAALTRG